MPPVLQVHQEEEVFPFLVLHLHDEHVGCRLAFDQRQVPIRVHEVVNSSCIFCKDVAIALVFLDHVIEVDHVSGHLSIAEGTDSDVWAIVVHSEVGQLEEGVRNAAGLFQFPLAAQEVACFQIVFLFICLFLAHCIIRTIKNHFVLIAKDYWGLPLLFTLFLLNSFRKVTNVSPSNSLMV